MTREFAVTFDYLCPFARNAAEAVAAGIGSGKDWSVRFVPFSLSEVHLEEGEPHVWERDPGDRKASGVAALAWGIAIRDSFPERFLDYHLTMFAARHERGLDVNNPAVPADVAASVGLDSEAVARAVDAGEPLDRLAAEHTEAVERWRVFGVPTFIEGDAAVFVRMMDRGPVEDLERVLDILSWTNLNEFKRTVVPR
jgi:hypothetical protein